MGGDNADIPSSETARSMMGSRKEIGPCTRSKLAGPWVEAGKHEKALSGNDKDGRLMADNNDGQAAVKKGNTRATAEV